MSESARPSIRPDGPSGRAALARLSVMGWEEDSREGMGGCLRQRVRPSGPAADVPPPTPIHSLVSQNRPSLFGGDI